MTLANSFKKTFNKILLFVIVVYAITAYSSHGYYHADEHYQLIEFGGVKLGSHTAKDLPWEYKKQIRPALQPIIGVVLLKTFNAIGIFDPYNQMFLFRLLSALLAIGIIGYFIRQTIGEIKNPYLHIPYILLSFFLWFIPVISVRFSSETWSGLFFLLAVASLFQQKDKEVPFLKIGIWLGLSFLFRYQMVFAMIGLGAWLIVVNRTTLKNILKVLSAFCLFILLGVALDSWFYGELVCAPWNYFYQNIIEGVAAGFGTSPWYYYLIKLFYSPSYIIGTLMILSIIVVLVKVPRNIILWCFLSFIIGHSLIGHKEERFLYPMVYFFPYFLIKSYTFLSSYLSCYKLKYVLNTLLCVVLIGVNTIGVLAMGVKSAGIGRMEITRYIHTHYQGEKVNLIYCSWANPYNPWHSLPVKFYVQDSLTDQRINTLCELHDTLYSKEGINLLVIRKVDKGNCLEQIQEAGFTKVIQSIPDWVVGLNRYYKGLEEKQVLELYHYSKKNDE